MKVLLTGATSFLGAATARALLDASYEVATFQRGALAADLVGNVEDHRGDIADTTAVDNAMSGCDAVVHLAARVSPVGTWAEFEAANVDGTRHVIAAARRHGVGRLVQVSTPSVAPVGHGLVGAGAEPAQPEGAANFYVRSKAVSEIDALAAAGPDLAVVAIRPHLVWGPGDTQLIGRIVDRAAAGRLALVGSGAALIDTTFVTNAADALVAALERAPEISGEALVVTNGEPRPVAEILSRICDAAGLPAPSRQVPTPVAQAAGSLVERIWALAGREDDPPVTRFLADELAHAHWFDQRRTRELLAWQPAVSLDEGFALLAAGLGRGAGSA